MSGRDVRRVAARASTSAHHEKQQQVTRLVLAALENGVERIFLAQEPFRINERAVENLAQRDQVEILSFALTHAAGATETMIDLMWAAGCRSFIVLGGDGTNRIVSRRYPDCALMPLSTGTNNVFPIMIEASLAGAAAGLIASAQVPKEVITSRCKRIHIQAVENQTQIHDIALIDAVVLHNDSLGSLLPFQGDRLGTLLLTRAEPASVGLSPIGGYLRPAATWMTLAFWYSVVRRLRVAFECRYRPGYGKTSRCSIMKRSRLARNFFFPVKVSSPMMATARTI